MGIRDRLDLVTTYISIKDNINVCPCMRERGSCALLKKLVNQSALARVHQSYIGRKVDLKSFAIVCMSPLLSYFSSLHLILIIWCWC